MTTSNASNRSLSAPHRHGIDCLKAERATRRQKTTLRNRTKFLHAKRFLSLGVIRPDQTVYRISVIPDEANAVAPAGTEEKQIKIAILASEHESPFGPSWRDVMQHIGEKLRWTNHQFHTILYSPESQPAPPGPDIVLCIGLHEAEIGPSLLSTLDSINASIILCFECNSVELTRRMTVNGINPVQPSQLLSLRSLFPWSPVKKVLDTYGALQTVWSRYTSDDMVYCIQLVTHKFLTPLPEMTELGPDFESVKCIGRNCRVEVFNCLLDPQCRKALECIDTCGINDQVCSYRCIASYESTLLEQFSLCILQKHNCLRNSASIPVQPEVHPMETFRGSALTFEAAEGIFIGHGGEVAWSWRVAFGKNPAYDYFPCQFQLFYRGKAKGSMWYDPVFKVITLDGRSVWRRRHYRVRRTKEPGSYYFSVLDNGVTSNEFWRIVDAADDLSWALFYYSGAAAAAGISYTGAVLGTLSGALPDVSQMPRIEAALDRCGIKLWEISYVDNSCCENPPLGPQSLPSAVSAAGFME